MIYQPDPYWGIEVIRDDVRRGNFKAAIFDFDGTLSLVREGWQGVMISYFLAVLKETPLAEDEESLEKCVTDFVDLLTGKETIYQAIQLAEEVRKRGGIPLEPLEYKREYNRRLMKRIRHRIEGLKSRKIIPEDMVVPGTFELLTALKEKGLVLYLASGTDEPYVLDEAKSLGIDVFFDGIYGAQDQYKLFSKAKVINYMIEKHHLSGDELLGFGDGFVEIENVKSAGGLAVGVASDEVRKEGINQWKRNRLIKAGADIIIPNYRKTQDIIDYLFST